MPKQPSLYIMCFCFVYTDSERPLLKLTVVCLAYCLVCSYCSALWFGDKGSITRRAVSTVVDAIVARAVLVAPVVIYNVIDAIA